MNEYKTEWIATIMLVSIVVGLVLLLSGCVANEKLLSYKSKCHVTCENCKKVDIDCEDDVIRDVDLGAVVL